MSVILPSLIPTSPRKAGIPDPSTMRPFLISRSYAIAIPFVAASWIDWFSCKKCSTRCGTTAHREIDSMACRCRMAMHFDVRAEIAPRRRPGHNRARTAMGGNDDKAIGMPTIIVAADDVGGRGRVCRDGGPGGPDRIGAAGPLSTAERQAGDPAERHNQSAAGLAAGPPVDLPRSRCHRARPVLYPASARQCRAAPTVDRGVLGRGPGLVKPGPISRVQRCAGKHPVPLHLG